MNEKQVSFCCDGFRQAIARVDQRGWSIFVTEINGAPCFFICFNGMDFVEFEKLSEGKAARGTMLDNNPITIGSEMAISFCPWCGTRLKRKYRSSWQLFQASEDRGYLGWYKKKMDINAMGSHEDHTG